ncbi:DUF4240 domain-containing protein [Nocardioides zhouii]|uniref:DUF4240 domain-containing protein n=1 Tax=Nocardioides zhouii TaxID=1168729 RepID=A0A4Q2T3C9_9ACTN|nr:DUF4240 domain-containing protein [Nocardioides zhouii]RYC11308.1 DUF4240 domain-containing protein [Nocardioides zhouii]
MTGVGVRMSVAALLGALALAGCGSDAGEPATSGSPPPAYCSPTGSGHEKFWEVVHASCTIALRSSTDVSDDICAPGMGLGDDLSTDYRSWIVAHGQSAYDAVLADPEALRAFPDARAGCGLGEFFGAAAHDLYLEMTGLSARKSGLPLLEVPARS